MKYYMGQIGKQNGQQGKCHGNPLNLLKKLSFFGGRVWGEGRGGGKNLATFFSGNLKDKTFYFRPKELAKFIFSCEN